MPTESDLRDSMHSADVADSRSIDTQSVIRRSRRRRLPRQVGVGGLAMLAVGGIGVVSVQGIAGLMESRQETTITMESDDGAAGPESGGAANDTAISRAPAYTLNLCGGELADIEPSATGLVVTVDFPDAAVGQSVVEGTVTLTNTGPATITGYSDSTPAITLSQNGVTLWHSNGPTIAMMTVIDLAPGASVQFPASFTPVVCAVEDDTLESFRGDLPAAPAGDYQVSAALDVMLESGVGSYELVTGPVDTVTLR